MIVIKDPKEVQDTISRIKLEKKTVGLVPTMGALHKAHASLIDRAKNESDYTVVTIFVNPTQFGPGEDYQSYPRTFDEDLALCEGHGVGMVFAPGEKEMYPGSDTTIVDVDELGDTMCGEKRPGHFQGVATVVAKLFNIVKPDKAYFGQKDYQQYKVIERMVHNLNYDLELIMCDTFREDDGLAVSSRNKYLDDQQRLQAPFIYQSLTKGKEMISNNEKDTCKIIRELTELINNNIEGSKIDYIGIFDADSLKEIDTIEQDVVIAAAVQVGKARLIDNVVVKVDG